MHRFNVVHRKAPTTNSK